MKRVCDQLYYKSNSNSECEFIIRSRMFEIVSTILSIIICYYLFQMPILITILIIFFIFQITSSYIVNINFKDQTIVKKFLFFGIYKIIKYEIKGIDDVYVITEMSWNYGPSEFTKSARKFEFVQGSKKFYFCSLFSDRNVQVLTQKLEQINLGVKFNNN